MKKAVIFGYGNVGKSVAEALVAADDFELFGIVSKSKAGQTAFGVKIVSDMADLGTFDVAVLCLPSRTTPDTAAELLKKGIPTVDSFDIHGLIPEVRKQLGEVAKENNTACVISAGWDPGTDSIIRTVMLAMAPKGVTYTNFGPGMSMGHTVAVKAIKGIKDALSMTIPAGTGIHKRMVYVEIEDGFTLEEITNSIKTDDYFVHDEVHVQQVSDINELIDMGHGVVIERKGVSGETHNQLFNFEMRINNPALTAQILVCAARAVLKQQPGCYTLIEIAPVDFLSIDRDEAVKALV